MTKSIYPLTERQERFVAMAQALAAKFDARAAEHDRAGTFPFENYDDLRSSKFPSWVVPTEYGGMGATLLETVLITENLAVGDGSTALSATMHLQTVGGAAETRAWPEALFEKVCRAAVEQNALVNHIASEPELGSPSRGGKPATTATPVASDSTSGSQSEGYCLNGRKNFASMVPTLDFMIVPATLQEDDQPVASFVLTPGPGVEIIETWDSLGMRCTGSHDVVFKDVFVPASQMIPPNVASPTAKPKVNAWFTLNVSAAYVGVATAALQSAARYAQERVPTALGKPIAQLESIQRRLGEAELLLHQARTQLYHTAELWTRYPDRRADLSESVIVAKYTATNNAIAAVDHAMRVAGGASMTKRLPLERYYRDVRGGLSHPMSDDQIFTTLGQLVIARNSLE